MMQENEEIYQQDGQPSSVQRAVSLLVTLMLILAVLLCLYVVVQVMSNGYVNIGGYMMFRVVTGSMEPTIPEATPIWWWTPTRLTSRILSAK